MLLHVVLWLHAAQYPVQQRVTVVAGSTQIIEDNMHYITCAGCRRASLGLLYYTLACCLVHCVVQYLSCAVLLVK
jgi:hypothetical protein